MHFGHRNVWGFRDDRNEVIRKWAKDMEEGEEKIKQAWNETVGKDDLIYVLGDFAIARRAICYAGELNGRKILVRGNHDSGKIADYLPYFIDIRGDFKCGSLILSHYPVHPGSIPKWCTKNVHGHTHAREVLTEDGLPDYRYRNVCVEVERKPVELGELL